MPKLIATREETIAAVAAVFRAYGYEGASISRFADATSLGRSSLYNHFPDGKPDMAASAAAAASADFCRLVIEPLMEEGPPAVRLGRAVAGLEQFYQFGRKSCLIEHFSMPDATLAAPGAAQAMAEAAIAAFGALAVSAGAKPAEARAKAEQALIEIQGGLVVARALGRPLAFKNALLRLPEILLNLPVAAR